MATGKFTDLDLDFLPHPITQDVTRKIDDEAIKRAVRNLILTNSYERPFHPELSSGIRELLFENMTPLTAQVINNRIKDVIRVYEPRVDLIDVAVDMNLDANRYGVTILFRLKNTMRDINLELALERIR